MLLLESKNGDRKKSLPGDSLEVDWMGGFTHVDGDSPPTPQLCIPVILKLCHLGIGAMDEARARQRGHSDTEEGVISQD